MTKTWTRGKIMRWIVAPFFAVVSLILLIVGILDVTLFQPGKIVSADLSTTTHYVVTADGVANLMNSNVDVIATSHADKKQAEQSTAETEQKTPDTPSICIAYGKSVDVNAWLQNSSEQYTEISGLKNWSALNSRLVRVDRSQPKNSVSFADSDLWSHIVCSQDKNTERITLNAVDSNHQIIVYSPQGVESVRMIWQTRNVTNHAIPLFAWAAVVFVLAILSLTWWSSVDPFGLKRRKEKQDKMLAEQLAQLPDESVIPGLNAPYEPYKKKSKTGITHRSKKLSFLDKFLGHVEPEENATDENQSHIVVDPSSVELIGSTGTGDNDMSWSPSFINRHSSSLSETDDNASETKLTGEELLEYLTRLAIEDRHNSAQDDKSLENEDTVLENSEENNDSQNSEETQSDETEQE